MTITTRRIACFACALSALLAAMLFITGCASNNSETSSEAPAPSNTVIPTEAISDTPAAGQGQATPPATTQPTENTAEENQRLQSDLAALATASPMDVSATCIDLTNGATASIAGMQQHPAASMIKLLIAAAFFDQAQLGLIALDDEYTLEPGDIVGGTGSLQGRGAGTTITYGEAVTRMISESDNVATNILIDELGMTTINSTAIKLGLTGTQLQRKMMDENAIAAGIDNYTSSDDTAKLLQQAYEGTLISADASAYIMDALRQQTDSEGILGGLPAGTPFAHKTGTLGYAKHDAGVVEGDHPFVLAVLCSSSDAVDTGSALGLMAEIGSAAYNDIVVGTA